MTPTTDKERLKKRKIPTFQHLPLNRAKKLKKTWVETQKIKSKWKGEKRKGPLSVSSKDNPGSASQVNAEDQRDNGRDSKEKMDSSGSHTQQEEDEEDQMKEPEISGANPVPRSGKIPRKEENERRRKHSSHEPAKPAYSKSALHTKRSESSHRGRGSVMNQGRSGGNGANALIRGRGRGQPDMRLRMNLILEKIERGLP